MAKTRKVRDPQPGTRNHYIVDACFVANWAIPPTVVPHKEQYRHESCMKWWAMIEHQVKTGKARIYAPDICIAEAFKVLAKKYYVERWFTNPLHFNRAKRKLRNFVTTPTSTLKRANRKISFHDVATTRDITVSIDRFHELFHKNGLHRVSVPDLIIVSTAKYLIDFFDLPKHQLHIITLDKELRKGSKVVQELPNAYDPAEPADAASKVFA